MSKRFTKREDKIVLGYPLAEAARRLPRRGYDVINNRRRRLLRLQKLKGTVRGSFTDAEIRLMREHYPTMPTTRFCRYYMHWRSYDSVTAKASQLGLKKVYYGTTVEVFANHSFELIDQIRMRAKADGMSFRALDRELGTNGYFLRTGNYIMAQAKRVNLLVVLKAVDYFGGKLVIDWQDR